MNIYTHLSKKIIFKKILCFLVSIMDNYLPPYKILVDIFENENGMTFIGNFFFDYSTYMMTIFVFLLLIINVN